MTVDLYIILLLLFYSLIIPNASCKLYTVNLSTATGNSTPTKISRFIATVLPDGNCDASGQFRVYTEKDLVAHCIHQNVC